MLVISHRGYHVDVHENTIQAFERALAMGVDGIETDVRLTVDGVPILFHDHATRSGRNVSSLSLDEITAILPYSVPTLDDLETLVVNPSHRIIWNLEVKVPEALNATLSFVDRHSGRSNGSPRFMVTSFFHTVAMEAAQRSEVECGALVAHRPLPFRSRPDWLGDHPRLNTIVWDYRTIDASLISDAGACGLRNFVYGAVTRDDHDRAAAWGVDAIITDHPEFALYHSSRSPGGS